MSDDIRAILDGIKHAIKIENNGYYFYKMAADSIKDSKGKEIFKSLAEEELSHKKFLEAQFKSYLEKGEYNKTHKLPEKSILSEDSVIFSSDIMNRIGDAHYEITALAIATMLELQAIYFYKDQVKSATSPEVKEFYQKLADWETTHYDALIHQDESLKQEYWAQHGFSPF